MSVPVSGSGATRLVCTHVTSEAVADFICMAPTRAEQVSALMNGWEVYPPDPTNPGRWMWVEPDGDVHFVDGNDDLPPWNEELRTLLHEKWNLHRQ